MPGVYEKPPKRSELLKEVSFILSLLKRNQKDGDWSEVMNTGVPMLLDLFAAERSKARSEASAEKEKQEREREEGQENGRKNERPLSELEARKEKEVAEVFFVGGVHAEFCDILKVAGHRNDTGDVMPILAVSRMAAVFDAAHCRVLTEGLQRLKVLWADPKGLTHVAQTLASVALFGLGPPLVSALIPASLLWVGASNLIRETRCPCSPCELQRRLLKISRNRDEIGVVQAAKDKKQICMSLVRGGGPGILREIFRTVASMRRRTGPSDSPVSEEQTVCEGQTGAQDHCYLDQALQFASWTLLLCSWPYEELHSGESILEFDNQSLLNTILDCFPVNDHGFLDSVSSLNLPGASSLLSVTLHLLLRLPAKTRAPLARKVNVIFRQVLEHLSRNIAARDPYTVSGKFFANYADIVPSDPPQTTDSATEDVNQDAHEEQRITDARPTVEILLLTPLFMGLLQSTFSEQNHDSASRGKATSVQVPSHATVSSDAPETDQDGGTEGLRTQALVTVGIAACQSLIDMYEYLRPLLSTWNGLDSRCSFVQFKGPLTPEIKKPFLPSRECLPPCTAVSLMPGFDFRGFYYSLVSAMLTLLGGMRLHSLPVRRWRFAENPAAKAGGSAAVGGLASAARKLLDFQKKELTEGCSYIKSAAAIVIMRAEQASALLLREEAHLKAGNLSTVVDDEAVDEECGTTINEDSGSGKSSELFPSESACLSREKKECMGRDLLGDPTEDRHEASNSVERCRSAC
ncbi:hypothetical protein BESB_036230 [Besnoitia besnoiti]|uniref:Uncharacterized protein n=1 Tax=Besnoitia besnoiti TaxID=94643 RepID=A0A2A9MGR0_BESBE|nr:hypothetical protein BESB_036230 [Besnoitia besnoiti]PFH37165.1 hypothetical protein BESB_036230 [Besnoitia besnoiti]